MSKFQHWYSAAHRFMREHFLLFLVLFLVGWWVLDNGTSVHYTMEQSNSAFRGEYGADSMAPQAKMVARDEGMNIVSPAYADFDPEATERKIIKNGSLELEVEDTQNAKKEAEDQIQDLGGSITHSNSWEIRPNILAYNMTLRVPSEKFEEAIEKLSFLGIKKSESFSTSDITAQYRDTENRLKNLESRRERLRELMERETTNLADVLQIDKELSNVQTQIENLQQTLRRHDANVAYSVLQLTLRPEPQIGDVQNPHWSAQKTWRQAMNELIQDAQKLADKFIFLIAYIPIWVPLLIIFWWLKKKFWNKKKTAK